MKKRNLLSLGALALSLGLTVSSCAGSQGEVGPVGPEGPQGPQGEQGQPGPQGDDGKTYYAVIVLNERVSNGTITQDKYFVEAGETFTLTFEPSDPSLDLVVDFEINGVEITLDPTATSYTYTATESDKGFQITSAVFTNALNYGQTLVTDALKEISDKDPLVIVQNATADGDFVADEDSEGYVGAKFADETLYTTVLSEALAGVSEALAELDEDATASEQLTAAETAGKAGATAIQEAYAELLADAKQEAKDDVVSYNEDITDEAYTEADSTKAVSDAQAAIDACTTLAQVSAIVNDTPTDDMKAGSFYTLTKNKQEAFKDLQDAYNRVVDTESWLEDPESPEYKNMVNSLTAYGVNVDSLPGAILKDYQAQVSAATELPVDSKGNIVLAKEGVDAISDCIDGLKEELAANIVAKYTEEINSSAALSSMAEVRSRAIAAVQQVVSNFVAADINNSTPISLYVSSDGSGKWDDEDVSADAGLIYRIEDRLAATDINVEAFKTERLLAAVNEVVSGFNTQLATLKAADKTLAAVNGGFARSQGATSNDRLVTVSKIGEEGYEIDNPFLASSTTVSEEEGLPTTERDNYQYVGNADSNFVNVAAEFGEKVANLDLVHEDLVRGLLNANGTINTANATSVSKVRTYGVENADVLSDTYEGMREIYKTATETENIFTTYETTTGKGNFADDEGDVSKLVVSSKKTSNEGAASETHEATLATFITEDHVRTAWNAKTEEVGTLDAISSMTKSTLEGMKLLVTLDKGVSSFVGTDRTVGTDNKVTPASGLYASDPDYVTWWTNPLFGSLLYEEFLGEDGIMARVLSGEAKASDVSRWVRTSNLESIYTEDVAGYKEDTVDRFTQAYQNLIRTDLPDEQYNELKAAFAKYSGWLGHKIVQNNEGNWVIKDDADDNACIDYRGETLTSVNAWFDAGIKALNIAAGTSTINLPTIGDAGYPTGYKAFLENGKVTVLGKDAGSVFDGDLNVNLGTTADYSNQLSAIVGALDTLLGDAEKVGNVVLTGDISLVSTTDPDANYVFEDLLVSAKAYVTGDSEKTPVTDLFSFVNNNGHVTLTINGDKIFKKEARGWSKTGNFTVEVTIKTPEGVNTTLTIKL